ncbi:hypothetical protein CURTO8I2_220237 [Curtobacterium sp. 8I-2]|nr:hypothetical protein CURTO8I2_220237 [Curtobacterium sp. 8I-2]
MLPGVLAGELVRAVADRVLTEGLSVLVELRRQRDEGRVAKAGGPVGVGPGQCDGELGVALDLEAGELGVLLLVETLDVVEEVTRALGVAELRCPVPRLGERLGGDLLAVRELLARLEHDVVRLGVGRLDALCEVVHDGAVRLVGLQASEHRVDDLAATGLGGVRRDEGVLRFGPVGGDVLGGVVAGAPGARAAGQGDCCGPEHGESCKPSALLDQDSSWCMGRAGHTSAPERLTSALYAVSGAVSKSRGHRLQIGNQIAGSLRNDASFGRSTATFADLLHVQRSPCTGVQLVQVDRHRVAPTESGPGRRRTATGRSVAIVQRTAPRVRPVVIGCS